MIQKRSAVVRKTRWHAKEVKYHSRASGSSNIRFKSSSSRFKWNKTLDCVFDGLITVSSIPIAGSTDSNSLKTGLAIS